MDAIIGFFSAIGDFIVGGFDFLLGIIRDLVYIVKLTGKAVGAIPRLFSFLPPAAVALLVTIFGVVVIYKILGREG